MACTPPPDLWKKQGKVNGLKARGNFTVDMEWKDGKIISYSISSPEAKKVKVKVNGELKEITAKLK
ncbi:MAG: glycoside hydrolase family 95-like protein [Mangrovibacterium sp.]